MTPPKDHAKNLAYLRLLLHNPESEEEGVAFDINEAATDTDLSGRNPPGPCPDFELDEAANLGSMLLQGCSPRRNSTVS